MGVPLFYLPLRATHILLNRFFSLSIVVSNPCTLRFWSDLRALLCVWSQINLFTFSVFVCRLLPPHLLKSLNLFFAISKILSVIRFFRFSVSLMIEFLLIIGALVSSSILALYKMYIYTYVLFVHFSFFFSFIIPIRFVLLQSMYVLWRETFYCAVTWEIISLLVGPKWSCYLGLV